jgi:hypothetical protein
MERLDPGPMKLLILLVAAMGCGRSNNRDGAMVGGQSGYAGVTSVGQSSSGGNQQSSSSGSGGVDAGTTSFGGAGGVETSGVGGNSIAGGATILGSGGTAGVTAGGTTSAGSGGTIGAGGAATSLATGGGTTGGTVGLGGSGGSGGAARGGSGGTTGGTVGLGGSGGSGGTARGGSGGTTGGSVGLGGSGGSGGTARGGNGGSADAGGTAAGGRGGMGGSIVAPPGDAGTALSDYCSGDRNKLTYLGQDLSPPATNCPSWIAMDCCEGFGVNLHTLAQLGFDLDLDITVQVGNVPPGQYSIGLGTSSFRNVTIRKYGAISTMSPPVPMVGTLTTSGSFYGPAAWDVGLCLETSDASTRVYIPHVTMIPFSMRSRFQIFRLADQSITPTQAQAKSLDSLVLAPSPLLDLGEVYYVEQSTDNIGTSYGSVIISSLSSGVPLSGSPFVVKVDGVPIYLGTFFRLVSSMMPVGPVIIVDNITNDLVPISAPKQAGNDPRFDPRIVAALSETGKLVP